MSDSLQKADQTTWEADDSHDDTKDTILGSSVVVTTRAASQYYGNISEPCGGPVKDMTYVHSGTQRQA